MNIFQRWGRVAEIFMASRKNQSGRRYGFVRFQGVRQHWKLEKQVDNIYIGNTEFSVNLPKYGRYTKLFDSGRDQRPLKRDKEKHKKTNNH